MSGMTTDIELVNKDGIRIDGRTAEDMRPLKIDGLDIFMIIGIFKTGL